MVEWAPSAVTTTRSVSCAKKPTEQRGNLLLLLLLDRSRCKLSSEFHAAAKIATTRSATPLAELVPFQVSYRSREAGVAQQQQTKEDAGGGDVTTTTIRMEAAVFQHKLLLLLREHGEGMASIRRIRAQRSTLNDTACRVCHC